MLSSFSRTRFLATCTPVRSPASLVLALSKISPFSLTVLAIRRSSLGKASKPAAYSASCGAISASSAKNCLTMRKASQVVPTCINSSGSKTLPMRARLTCGRMLYAPPNGKRLPSSKRRSASAVSSCKRFTEAKSLSMRMFITRSRPSEVAVLPASISFTLSNSNVCIANLAIILLIKRRGSNAHALYGAGFPPA